MEGMRISSTAITAGQTSLDVTANNLANVNTTGFKSDSTNYNNGPGGRGVEVGAISKNTLPGPIGFTSRNFDLAIQGDGFFSLRRGDGSLAFTRDGAFTIDAQGRFATQNGELLDPGIAVPSNASSINISKEGTVTAQLNDGTRQEIGKIQPVKFPNPAGLEDIGNNLSVPTAASGAGMRRGDSEILQGALEFSNTDIATEMTNLIKDQRYIEANTKAFQAQDEIFGTVIDMKR